MNHGEIVSFLWGVADLIRDTFKRGKYQDVILPLTVLRRLSRKRFSPLFRSGMKRRRSAGTRTRIRNLIPICVTRRMSPWERVSTRISTGR